MIKRMLIVYDDEKGPLRLILKEHFRPLELIGLGHAITVTGANAMKTSRDESETGAVIIEIAPNAPEDLLNEVK